MEKMFQKGLKEDLFLMKEKVLVAVSGGPDSVVLTHLLHNTGLKIGLAHFNYRQREEADQDEAFVKQLADSLDVPFYCSHQTPSEKGKSLQESARDLRYSWFKQLVKKEGYDLVATAHHRDDQLESFFINLMRNSGYRGLAGIPKKSGIFIRPLLSFSKQELLDHARKKNLSYRVDSSNSSPHRFLRNKIRLNVLPVIDEVDPDFRKTLNKEIEYFKEVRQVLEKEVEQKKVQLVQQEEDKTIIPIPPLQQLQPIRFYLFELLRPHGFKGKIIEDIYHALNKQPGKTFSSSTHRLFKEREELVIFPLEKTSSPSGETLIPKKTKKIQQPLALSFNTFEANNYSIDKNPKTGAFDLNKLDFPLKLRPWNPGDTLQPLGMKGSKKVQDLLTDKKVPLHEKKAIHVLLSQEEIIWVIGIQISEQFKVTEKTKEVLEIKNLS